MEAYRSLLLALNENIINIRSCNEYTHPKLKVKPLVPYFYGTTSPCLEVSNGELVLASYEVIFTPAHLPGKADSSLWKEDIRKFFGKDYQNYDDLVQNKYDYYPCFVGDFLPREIEVENCHGDRCRTERHVYYTGIWCESCHGEFEDNVDFNLSFLINDKVYLKDFPPQCIIRIKKKTEPIPDSFTLQEHLDKLKKRSALGQEIRKRLAVWDEETDRLQKQLLQQREEERQSLLTYKDHSQVLEEVNQVLERKAREKEAREKEERIKVLEEEARKKREELDRQLEELNRLRQI
ncbi:hypothetical protein [Cedratvirus kamchatka]|uniref:Uncharacterized protein n=1 Tax=Cedratvirus kamchatka TaxID=2716914 RepID=A0A6G8MY61_9VIRU|nr:hypothetical protein [Cedratvirus kamchatka]